jgi:peptidyl-prolyl cis-trans isomerase B (cyclophilin B)
MKAFVMLVLALLILSGCTGETKATDKTKGETMEIAVFETSAGTFEVELNRSAAPVTVSNFVNYTSSGFYDGTIFHRVMKGFMVQGGGFTPDGSQKTTKDPIKLESRNGLKNMKGTIAMARTSVPDSATSQFFINTVDNGFLNYAPGVDGYAVFGKVVNGMDVIQKIETVQTGSKGPYSDWPAQDVVITKAYMKK